MATITDHSLGVSTRLEHLPGLPELWAETTGSPDVCIAVLDGLADLGHPCLRGAKVEVIDPLGRGRISAPSARQHGTAVASLVFGQHNSGFKGVAPGCRGILIPIYRETARGLVSTQEDLALAIREAVRLGANVINVSGGELVPGGRASRELAGAVQHCAEKGRLLVAAAGNDGCAECLHVPAAIPSVLVVGAVESDGRPLDRSNWGGTYRLQGIVAPGRNLVIATPGGGYGMASGTSLATPLVSGVAALLASVQRKHGSAPDLRAIRETLLRTASGCDEQPVAECDRLLVGRMNISRATSSVFPFSKGFPMSGPAESMIEQSPVVAPSLPGSVLPGSILAEGTTSTRISPTVPIVSTGITPSHCGCGGSCGCGGKAATAQYVYVIGDRIGYDFGSRVRQYSLQANADPAYHKSLSDPAGFIRYLLGSRKFGAPTNGNMHDAKSVHWVLYQDNCPRYVIQPHGDFSETLYKALIVFLIETTSFGFDAKGKAIEFTDPTLDLRYECLKEYFDCHGGSQDPLESEAGMKPVDPSFQQLLEEDRKLLERFQSIYWEQSVAQNPGEKPEQTTSRKKKEEDDPLSDLLLFMNESPSRAAKVAIAGTLSNKRVTLADGQQVEVIHPDLRGMSSWNTVRLLRVALQFLSGPQGEIEADAWSFVARITSRLYELTRNDGKSPQERAVNWAATAFLQQVRPLLRSRTFRDLIGGKEGLKAGAVNDIQVHPASCQESGGEYDVEISLFSVESVLRGLTVVASNVDVSDVVPVTLSRTRVFNKRS